MHAPLITPARYLDCLRHGRAWLADDGLDDERRDELAGTLLPWLERRRGTVYVAINPVLPDLYKIGRTRRAVTARLADLRQAGVPGYFAAIHQEGVQDAPWAEAEVHRRLDQEDLRVDREFFRGGFARLIHVVREVAYTDATIVVRACQLLGLEAPAMPQLSMAQPAEHLKAPPRRRLVA